jgi:hypothetical protein
MAGVTAFAVLPQPIANGVLTGPLNVNGQSLTNVASVTFADGTTQTTAGGSSGGNPLIIISGGLIYPSGQTGANGGLISNNNLIYPQ